MQVLCPKCFKGYEKELGCPCQGGTGGLDDDFKAYQRICAENDKRLAAVMLEPGQTIRVPFNTPVYVEGPAVIRVRP
jgi:hypothetical protein